jgi:precorrin isomerase
MTMRRPTVPVLLERDFRKMAATEGATVEIECVSAPKPDERLTGEWLFYVVNAEGERFMLVTAVARERIVTSPIGMFGLAFSKLALDHLDVPAVAGDVRGGMRSRPGGGDPVE